MSQSSPACHAITIATRKAFLRKGDASHKKPKVQTVYMLAGIGLERSFDSWLNKYMHFKMMLQEIVHQVEVTKKTATL